MFRYGPLLPDLDAMAELAPRLGLQNHYRSLFRRVIELPAQLIRPLPSLQVDCGAAFTRATHSPKMS